MSFYRPNNKEQIFNIKLKILNFTNNNKLLTKVWLNLLHLHHRRLRRPHSHLFDLIFVFHKPRIFLFCNSGRDFAEVSF